MFNLFKKKPEPQEEKNLKFESRYSYEWKDDVPESERTAENMCSPFCAKMMEMHKLYTRSELQKISAFLGYDVVARGGGYWKDEENGIPCKHTWKSQIVQRK